MQKANSTKQREVMVERYIRAGYLVSEELIEAMRRVRRELFMPKPYVRYAYHNHPYPIPGNGRQTISAPHTYGLFYEALELKRGDKLLEVGTGSGYGAALAKKVVGEEGKVVTIEINRETYEFGKENLRGAGYDDVLVVHSDGSKGYAEEAPYSKICVTAACPQIPQPLKDQLNAPGKLISPVGPPPALYAQDLILLEKDEEGRITSKPISKVVYVPLTGEHGWKNPK